MPLSQLRERISEKLLEALELHSDVVKTFSKRHIVSRGIDELWAGDLLIMSKFSSENKGYNYVLNLIDVFSKYIFLQPLKTKSGSEVAAAFKKLSGHLVDVPNYCTLIVAKNLLTKILNVFWRIMVLKCITPIKKKKVP